MSSPAVALAWLYPDELVLAGPVATADLLERTGFDGGALALTYHQARQLLPRFSTVRHSPPGACFFAPRVGSYRGLAPHRTADDTTVRAVHDFREQLSRRGIKFHAWLIMLHNEPLVAARPDLAATTIDGTPTLHALCPSHEEVRAYATDVVADVVGQLSPDGVELEAVLPHAWLPSYAVSLELAPLSSAAQVLAGQCFCASCRALLSAGGNDPDEVRHAALAAAGAPFSAVSPPAPPPPVLAALREEVTRIVLDDISRATGQTSTSVRVLVFDDAEGVALRGLTPAAVQPVAGVGIGTGTATGPALDDVFRAVADRLTEVPLMASLNWAPGRDASGFTADVDHVVTLGARAVSLYNLSLLPADALPSVAAAAHAARERLSTTPHGRIRS